MILDGLCCEEKLDAIYQSRKSCKYIQISIIFAFYTYSDSHFRIPNGQIACLGLSFFEITQHLTVSQVILKVSIAKGV